MEKGKGNREEKRTSLAFSLIDLRYQVIPLATRM